MTEFTQFILSQYSTLSVAFFETKGIEYQVKLQRISAGNLYDSSVIFPKYYQFSARGCWEVTFDLAENITKNTRFQPPAQQSVSPVLVLRKIEKVIDDHYQQYRGGMYVFSAERKALAEVYTRIINRRLGKGTTLESGLDPDRRGYVIRTQTCYQKEN